jgi:hypothetical protein
MSPNVDASTSQEIGERDRYEAAKRQRQQRVDAIVKPASAKKIVVAGPGTAT